MSKQPAAAKPAAPKVDAKAKARELYDALLAHLTEAKIGVVTPHPKGIYARLMDGKRTFGYVVPRKDTLLVYPNILAASMPKGVTFQQVPIDLHHYGRGEVIITVTGKANFAAVVKSLKAAHENPIPKAPRTAADKAETVEVPAEAAPDAPAEEALAAPVVEAPQASDVKPDPKPSRKGAKGKTEEVAA